MLIQGVERAVDRGPVLWAAALWFRPDVSRMPRNVRLESLTYVSSCENEGRFTLARVPRCSYKASNVPLIADRFFGPQLCGSGLMFPACRGMSGWKA